MDLAVFPYSEEKKLLKGEQLGAGTARFFKPIGNCAKCCKKKKDVI